MPTQYASIYDRLVEASSRYVLPPAWSWLPADEACRQLDNAPDVFHELAARFPAEDLLASGVARQTGTELVINPRLAADDPGFIVLRNHSGDSFDIVTADGCLYGGVPALRMHRDKKTKDALQASDEAVMYVAFSMPDTILLRSLGVAVAPAALLGTLNLPGLQRLLRLVGGSARGTIPKASVRLTTDEPNERFSEMGVFQLILLACSMTSLTAAIPPTPPCRPLPAI